VLNPGKPPSLGNPIPGAAQTIGQVFPGGRVPVDKPDLLGFFGDGLNPGHGFVLIGVRRVSGNDMHPGAHGDAFAVEGDKRFGPAPAPARSPWPAPYLSPGEVRSPRGCSTRSPGRERSSWMTRMRPFTFRLFAAIRTPFREDAAAQKGPETAVQTLFTPFYGLFWNEINRGRKVFSRGKTLLQAELVLSFPGPHEASLKILSGQAGEDPHFLISLSNPGRMDLKKAFCRRLVMTSQVSALGLFSGPSTGVSVATVPRGFSSSLEIPPTTPS
jgi:hypothetical protein